MGASNTRVYPQTHIWVHLYICTHICWGYANAWFDHYSPIHQIPRSLFHCTLIARLVCLSLSLSHCGYLCMHILPSTALSAIHTHTGTHCRAASVRTAPRLLTVLCARARKSISNAFFCTLLLLLLLLLCRRRRQALKAAKSKKKTKKQRISDLASWNFDLQFSSSPRCSLLFFFFVQVYLLFAAPAAAAIVVSHSHSRCCCNFIGCACVGVQPILCPQSNSLALAYTLTLTTMHKYA